MDPAAKVLLAHARSASDGRYAILGKCPVLTAPQSVLSRCKSAGSPLCFHSSCTARCCTASPSLVLVVLILPSVGEVLLAASTPRLPTRDSTQPPIACSLCLISQLDRDAPACPCLLPAEPSLPPCFTRQTPRSTIPAPSRKSSSLSGATHVCT